MDCTLVSHTHWDREWYRTFEGFRARLVDAIDRILDLVASDPEFRFLLDGQTIVLEDYLEVRPERREELERACRERRIAIGPWYVQPDSLLPQGETHIRNLLEGRRVGEPFGGVSSVAYTPDSFGHPAQFPQIFSGFGLGPFVYWRGNGSEIDDLPAEYLWEAPDGTSILAHHLGEGYFGAAGLPEDPVGSAVYLQSIVDKLAPRTRNKRVLLMNGIDHAVPAAGVGSALEVMRRATGWTVRRGLLEDFVQGLSDQGPTFRGELVGGRIANLLPGVWSARLPLKLHNRRAEAGLLGWAEPWTALSRRLGLADEGPAVRRAWRALLCNQAHDSLCGCSQDRVHRQSEARYDTAIELAAETTDRCLERLAGLDGVRRRPWAAEFDIAVFNPSPHPRTDVVRFALEADFWVEFRGETERSMQVHPLLGATQQARGYTLDGVPARLVGEEDSPRLRLEPRRPPLSVEGVVRDIPPLGWRRVRLAKSDAHPDNEDEGREIAVDDLGVTVAADGTFDVRFGEQVYPGLGALEDRGDRGDTYDFDPVEGATPEPRIERIGVRRRRHPGGIQSLWVERVFSTPAGLGEDRLSRLGARVESRVVLEARLAPGVARVDLDLMIENSAHDHRLRLLFPTGAEDKEFVAATTSDHVRRRPGPRAEENWVHPPPATFVQQGFVHAGGLTVGAPGLPEAEVTVDGVIALTLVRSVGWLALMDLASRPLPAGPVVKTPEAQCNESFSARLTLMRGLDSRAVRDFELGLKAVPATDAPVLPEGHSLVAVESPSVLLETIKQAEVGDGIVIRLLNPTDHNASAVLRVGFGAGRFREVRLDEEPCSQWEAYDGAAGLKLDLPAHALRSYCFVCPA